nr:ATP-binding cassette domain-containing protein [Streptomyces sp. NP160]
MEGVTKRFQRGGSSVTAVDDVTLSVRRGEVLAVIGYSGAGKSTLVRLVNALELPTSGSVRVGGQDVTRLGEKELRAARTGIGMIFQQFNLLSSRTVAENVAYPLRVAGVGKVERERRTAELLDFVGLLERAHAHPEQLSGGQKQRVGIARALATSPPLLLADEATSALDPETTEEVLTLLRRVNTELGVTVMLITHEMEAVRRVADRVAVMERGRVVEVGDVYDVFTDPQTPAAQRFVRSATHDRPSAEALARLREHHPGRLVTVRVDDRPRLQQVIDGAFRDAGVTAELVFGGVGEIKERRAGSLTYELSGDAAGVERALTALRAQDVVVEEEV